MEETLTNEGYGVIRAYSGTEAVLLLSQVKPDLVAPGVEIMSCAPGGGYQVRTGTSMATPFVTGSAALLMQWGIVNGNDAYLYGEKMKAYLIRVSSLEQTHAPGILFADKKESERNYAIPSAFGAYAKYMKEEIQ